MMTIVYFIFGLCLFVVAMQCNIKDLNLLCQRINYKKSLNNYISYIGFVFGLIFLIYDVCRYPIEIFLVCPLFLFFITFFVWGLSKLNRNRFVEYLVIIISICLLFALFAKGTGIYIYSIFYLFGFYYRNNPFGAPFRKKFIFTLSRSCDFSRKDIIPLYGDVDFNYAGCKNFENKFSRTYNVKDYGIFPNTSDDVLHKVQNLVDYVGKNGGGTIFFPKGEYCFNKQKDSTDFLKINYSHVTLKGEVSSEGILLSKFVQCNNTLETEKNPWLSPFLITTGEKIQKSNMFWGIQFLKKKDLLTKSSSMTDPGSDGIILEPPYLTDFSKEAYKGDDVICVKDADRLKGYKYLLLGLFNTSDDGNLIKDILGVNLLRKEWKTALRAGEEGAPSYQVLVEIKEVLNGNKIRLTRPLLRHFELKYMPRVFGADMLEDIHIKNLCIESRWNGIFRHHGFPRYYSVKQAQEMDYGWNAINLKRVAHSSLENVIISDFSNPLYVQDSKNVTVKDVVVKGEDGHQGIKVYEHTCDCLFDSVVFYNHYADMIGGEGNAYANVFMNIVYSNPMFKPVDFDFHGFSEGPMSPPADNLFYNVKGFRAIKGAGADYNQPACAQNNIWDFWVREGNYKDEPYFYNIHYLTGANAVRRRNHNILFPNSRIFNVKE